MVTPSKEPLLVVLLGPTASGKTALSLDLARRWNGEIVSCDSVAIYRGLEIGAAKPSFQEREEIPHHLIDVAPPNEVYTAGDYSRAAKVAIADITARGKLPILTGGTGLYLRALLEGLFAGPGRSDALRGRLRKKAEDRSPAYLHRILRRLDPVSAGRIHANDLPKVMRAIEVTLLARKPMSQALESGREGLKGYRILRIGLAPARESLYARIDARAAEMFEEGLIEESSALLREYGTKETPAALSSLGYRQAIAYLRGVLTRQQAIDATRQGHRNYAKRQLTWFRREAEVHWLSGFGDDQRIQQDAQALVAAFAGQDAEKS